MHTRFICLDTAAHSKGYTRSRGVIALMRCEGRQISPALRHACQGLRYSLGTPGLGSRALLEWIRRRRVLGNGAMP